MAWKPRHLSWFEPAAEAMLCHYEIARVATDPARIPAAAAPDGWAGLVYYRLHDSPQTYHSAYEADRLGQLATAFDMVRLGLALLKR